MSRQSYDHLLKIALTGCSGSGKSTFCSQISPSIFDQKNKPIIDFRSKLLKCRGKKVKCQLWDLTGDKNYIEAIKTYYSTVDIIAFFVDLTNKDNCMAYFEMIRPFIQQINQNSSNEKTFFVVFTKPDLVSQENQSILTETELRNLTKMVLLNVGLTINPETQFHYYYKISLTENSKKLVNLSKELLNHWVKIRFPDIKSSTKDPLSNSFNRDRFFSPEMLNDNSSNSKKTKNKKNKSSHRPT